MEDLEPTKTFKEIIPEFYYDLISRIPPGIFLVIGILVEYTSRVGERLVNFKDASGGFSALVTILLLLAGYSMGLFLTVPAKGIAWLYVKYVWEILINKENKHQVKPKMKTLLHELGIELKENISRTQARQIHRTVHDYLAIKSPHAKFVLQKLLAESALCENTVIAIVVYLFVHGVNNESSGSEWYLYLVGILLCIVMLWFAVIRYYRAIERHISYLRIYINIAE